MKAIRGFFGKFCPYAFFVLSWLFVPSLISGGEAALRCRWTGLEGEALDLAFASSPLIVAPPESSIKLSAEGEDGMEVVVLREGRSVRRAREIILAAPENPGSYYIDLELAATAGSVRRDICVLVAHRAEARRTAAGFELSVAGEKIGFYPHPSRSGNIKVKTHPESYQPPVWWLRLTGDNAGFEVVPGLLAGDLVAVPEDGGPRHTSLVPVCYPMWRAVSTLRRELGRLGLPENSLRLISVFRTPGHNRAIGSNSFGRHIYGDAFDFYVGEGDSVKAMDLNRDGRLDRRDAWPLVGLIEDLQAEGAIPMGGVGVYNTVGGDHEVTLHLDLRGHRATWGYQYGASGRRSEFAWASRRFADRLKTILWRDAGLSCQE
ncbi:MAG: hypothetical protein LBE84_02785, partial [Planctomycetota bacterium]|nr:hypothetical protein [Planctomycetota bacterium]